ncbi:tnf 4 receptor-associated factor, partial [Mytilus galloprovincialis]
MDNDFMGRPSTRAESRMFSPQGMDGGILSDKEDMQYIFCSPLDKIYECPVCSNVLRYPVLFEECGHRCCASCLPELLRSVYW